MSIGEASGRRGRKRAESRARIEAAAVELVFAEGLDAASIEAISARADVSRRTFFNYFDSKDAAVLGVRPPEADEELMTAQLVGVVDLDPIEALVHLVMAAMGVVESVEAGLYRRRLEIMRRHPEIVAGQFVRLNARQDRLARHASVILAEATAADAAADPDPDAAAYGDIVLALCNSAVHRALMEWAQTADDCDGRIAVDRIEQRAVTLARATLRKLI